MEVARGKTVRLEWVALGAMLLALAGIPALAALSSVSDLFRAGNYDQARIALAAGGEGARPGEENLWRSRLATSPDEALEMLRGNLADSGLPASVAVRSALEAADILFGRGDFEALIQLLGPLVSAGENELPGAVYLPLGLAYRAGNNLQLAREMLASVRPSDPMFGLARFYLGDIALQQGDHALALRYFQAAEDGTSVPMLARIQAGRWQGLRAAGSNADAAQLVTMLQETAPGSLSLLEINRQLRQENEALAARQVTTPVDTVSTRPPEREGRFSLQYGAFRDRGLALEFINRYQKQIPDLRIERELDERGQYLYKLRSGSFINPALARSEARQMKKRLGMDVIVAELGIINLPSE